MNNHYCSNCNVFISKDLRFCPLCGKFVCKSETAEITKTNDSYPNIDMSYIYIVKWIKSVRAVLILLALLAVAINLFFETKVYWFPYVLAGLFSLWRICFYPFKEGKSHLSSIPTTGIIIALLCIFIDVYNYNFLDTRLGWALAYVVPFIFVATSVVSFILALVKKSREEELTKGLFYLGIVSILFFISKLLWFNEFSNWPIFVCLVNSFTLLFLLFLIKKKRLVKELNRNFHI